MLHPEFVSRPIAHRGYHDRAAGRPENSLAAVQAAIDAGYGIEIDIQPSKDGVPMVFHDYSLKRLTGALGPIAQRSAAELGTLPLLGTVQTIPTLAQVLEVVSGQVPLLIEVKDQDGALGPGVGALEERIAQILEHYSGPVALMSFNPHSMAAIAPLVPHIPRGLTTCTYRAEDWPTIPQETRDRLSLIPDYDRVGACFISHDRADLADTRVAELAAQGATILCWTIRSADQEAEARKFAANITFEGYRA